MSDLREEIVARGEWPKKNIFRLRRFTDSAGVSQTCTSPELERKEVSVYATLLCESRKSLRPGREDNGSLEVVLHLSRTRPMGSI